MTIVSLPGLGSMIEQISQQYNLSADDVEEALKEALIKGYERYRRAQNLDRDHFSEEYFENFEIELDTEEEEVDLGFAGGGAISGKRRRLLKQIEEEDEMILAFVSAFFQVGV